MTSDGSLQVCAGHEAGCEVLIHAMKNIFENEKSAEAILLVVASNAFNSLNRKLFLHNVKVICPVIATFVINCYSLDSRLFIIGGGEIKSREGTTQRDPVAMAIYAIAIIPFLLILIEYPEKECLSTKNAAFAETAAGKLLSRRSWWDKLCEIGPNFGYFPNSGKTWIVTKKT